MVSAFVTKLIIILFQQSLDIIECSGTTTLPAKFDTVCKNSMNDASETSGVKKTLSKKETIKVPLDELKDNDFVKINSFKKRTPKLLTEHQKEVRKTRRYDSF